MELARKQTKPNKTLAMALILFLCLVYFENVLKPYIVGPVPTPTTAGEQATDNKQPAATSSTASSATTSTPTAVQSPSQASITAATTPPAADLNPETFSAAAVSSAPAVVINTEVASYRLSLLGGRLTSLKLADYRDSLAGAKSAEGDAKADLELDLISHVGDAPYPLGVSLGSVTDLKATYRVESLSAAATAKGADSVVTLSDGNTAKLVLVGTLSDGRTIKKSLTFFSDSYFINLAASVSQSLDPAARVSAHWSYSEEEPSEESSMYIDPYSVTGFVWNDGESVTQMSFAEAAEEQTAARESSRPGVGAIGAARWVGMGDKYFMASLIATEGPQPTTVKAYDNHSYEMLVSGSETLVQAQIFAGPKAYDLLEAGGFELEKSINFGYFGFVAAPLLLLLHGFYGIFGNYGLAIIGITLLVKAVTFPLNSTSLRSMKAMQELQPDIKRIRERYKDKQKQQQEQMKLFQERGVNPMAGCLPMIIQMPIFIGLYSALILAVELRHAPFGLWVRDLSAPEHLELFGYGVPVMVILFVVAMAIQQWTTPSTADPLQKKMMMIVPLFMGFLFASFPAGLTLYMLTNSLVSIAQTRALQKRDNKTAMIWTAAVSGALLIGGWILTFF